MNDFSQKDAATHEPEFLWVGTFEMFPAAPQKPQNHDPPGLKEEAAAQERDRSETFTDRRL